MCDWWERLYANVLYIMKKILKNACGIIEIELFY